MKVFREQVEDRREKNRNRRFGGWKGLLLMIAIFIVVLMMYNSCTETNVGDFFDFITGKP